jgi:hypothetical protein
MSDELTTLLLLANMASTLFMVGLIWFVQIVHYPLFAQTGWDQFSGYHAAHAALTTRVVGGPMVVEAVTAAALAWQPPSPNLASACWVGLGLVIGLWVSTATVQIPNHKKLSSGFHPDTHRSLVNGNWIRSAAWSIRGALMLYVLNQTLRGGMGHGS